MPANKDLKRLVRGRMQKTGEAYTTARAHILKQKPTRHSVRPASSDFAKLAGKSDAILKEKTGCTWERWVGALDGVKAYTWPHTEIARYVREKYNVSGWLAQTVTVGYERIKGLRAVGQRRDGWFEANKSKTLKAPLSRVYQAFHNRGLRVQWLPGVEPIVRTASRNKSMRITWPDGTLVIAGFTRMGPSKSQVALTHAKLADQAAVTRAKQFWTERLAVLEKFLTT
ncbi:MAG TPA: hypothetical protein VHH32_11390 [Gemmatimonadales bacterium]|nr:hypothetical protein [Gemmatimonadales bacterium]